MDGVTYSKTDFFRLSIQSSPIKKRVTSIVAITILALSVSATSYLVCGFTSQVHYCSILSPLASISLIGLSFMSVSSLLLGIISLTYLVIIYKKQLVTQQLLSRKLECLLFLNEFFQQVSIDKIHKLAIRNFLNQGCTNFLDHYGFYYHLATISEKVLATSNESLINMWKEFLELIQGVTIKSHDSYHQVEINCEIEFLRLKGELPEFTIEEFNFDDSPLEDKEKIIDICRDAFGKLWTYPRGEGDQLKNLFLQNNGKFYVARSQNKKILGCLGYQKDQTNILKFHDLARLPYAVKLGMTEKFRKYLEQECLQEKFKMIWCEVLNENKPAYEIYRKLGFELSNQSNLYVQKNHFAMVYSPSILNSST
ncbi:MAG: GNAT family N-acetyltransferase [Chlamydiales bacterium]